jgi:hypothetical protein
MTPVAGWSAPHEVPCSPLLPILLRALIMSNRLQYRVTQLTNGNGDSLELRLVHLVIGYFE